MTKFDSPQHVVVFDLDHTLSRRDTFKPFLLRLVKSRPARLRSLPWLALSWLRYQFGQCSNEDMKNTFLDYLGRGLSRAELADTAGAHVSALLHHGLYAEALDALEKERTNGAYLILATASPDIYTVPLGKALGFDEVIASRLGWREDATFAGQLDGTNCYGKEKARRVGEWLERHPLRMLTQVYTDHISDLPLLAMAREGVAVNADNRLRSVSGGLALRHVSWGTPAGAQTAATRIHVTAG